MRTGEVHEKNMFSIFHCFLILISFQLPVHSSKGAGERSAPQQQEKSFCHRLPGRRPAVRWQLSGASGSQTSSSGLSAKSSCKNVEETTMAPVEPTLLYGAQDIFHAVVHIEDAPANSKIKSCGMRRTSVRTLRATRASYSHGNQRRRHALYRFHLTPKPPGRQGHTAPKSLSTIFSSRYRFSVNKTSIERCIAWLLQGEPWVVYRVRKDLLDQ